MTASPQTAQRDTDGEGLLDIASQFPADPDLMISPEGDTKGLEELKRHAQQRLDELGRPHYPETRA